MTTNHDTKPSAFLANELYTYKIAKFATFFQSIITVLIAVMLTIALFDVESTTPFIAGFLAIDTLFVIAHLSYRTLYKGPKVQLDPTSKAILTTHSVLALCALVMTFYYLLNRYEVSNYYIFVTIVIWFMSLVFGDMFFTRKYNKSINLAN